MVGCLAIPVLVPSRHYLSGPSHGAQTRQYLSGPAHECAYTSLPQRARVRSARALDPQPDGPHPERGGRARPQRVHVLFARSRSGNAWSASTTTRATAAPAGT